LEYIKADNLDMDERAATQNRLFRRTCLGVGVMGKSNAEWDLWVAFGFLK
jgi:hypothetical protein